MDLVIEYMKKNNIPITRENYIGINWMGDQPTQGPLPAELEAQLPEELQIQPEEKE